MSVYEQGQSKLCLFTGHFVLFILFGMVACAMKSKAYLLLSVLAILPGTAAEHLTYDSVYRWIDRPQERDPQLHLAFVEVIRVTDERYGLTNAPSSKVSDDGGKTWYSLLRVRSGMVALKVIESPGYEMPQTLAAQFERAHYVPSAETPWTDQQVVPGNRLLGFFRQQPKDRWALENSCFIDPMDYLLCRSPGGSDLQSFFKTELATPAAIEARRKVLGEAMQRARSSAATNTFNGK
jgi:hypothetical protein